jgi:hypothetical protein
VDDVGPHATGEPDQGRSHPEPADERHAEEWVEILELVDVEAVELPLPRIDPARRDVNLVPALREAGGPARKVARLRVSDAEDAERLRHGGRV